MPGDRLTAWGGRASVMLRLLSVLVLLGQAGIATLGATADAILDSPAESLLLHVESGDVASCHTPHNHFLCEVQRWGASLRGGQQPVLTAPGVPTVGTLADQISGPSEQRLWTQPDTRAPPVPARAV